jgi:hypothetical protein
MKIDKMGVAILMSHVIITVTVIVAYLITVYLGKPDEGLKVAIPIILGYWFGNMGKEGIRVKKENSSVEETKKGA